MDFIIVRGGPFAPARATNYESDFIVDFIIVRGGPCSEPKTMKVLAREARRKFGVLETPEPQNRAKSLVFHAFPGSSAGFCTHGLP